MFERIKLNTLEDYFLPSSKRKNRGVYFNRLTKYSKEVHQSICRYIETTRKAGVCISQRIGNPDEKQLSYYEEMMGREFQLNPNFFISALKKWIPRVQEKHRREIANSFYDIFIDMARMGKNENMQKNAYIKFMCWLYYKFEPIVKFLGNEELPKILFEGYVNDYELKMLTVLSKIGCDILLIQYHGDEKYRQVDTDSKYSSLLEVSGGDFPEDFSVLKLRKDMANQVREVPLKEFRAEKIINTNTWIKGDPYLDALMSQAERGTNKRFYYSLFAGIYGVEEGASYLSDLLKWKLKMERAGKKIILIEEEITAPSYEEIQQVQRKNYASANQLLNDMVMQIHCKNRKIETYCQQAFMMVMNEQSNEPMTKLLNHAVTMICWLNRYAGQFLIEEKEAVFLYYGKIKNQNERTFFKLLAKLPIDILIMDSEVTDSMEILDPLFFAKKYPNTIKRGKFPTDVTGVSFGTVAYQAEQELNTVLYQDTGLYRNQQFKAALPVPLKNTYEEIFILWDQEAKYRPNFETLEDNVVVPVIFSKVCGVPGSTDEYWSKICDLNTEDTFVIKEFPYANLGANPFNDKAYLFLQGNRLNKNKIINHPAYPFSFIREEMQDYMLNKLQELIDSNLIVGTGRNGMEYKIVATVLNMDLSFVRMIQKYDFTKNIPKVIAIHTKESQCSQEDSILLAYLHRIGFDIAMFVPTGYTSAERYFNERPFVEYQVGEYQYDMRIPDFAALKRKREGFASKLFRRGR